MATKLIRVLMPVKTSQAATYAELTGSKIAVSNISNYSRISYILTAAVQSITAKIQGSIDGATWIDLTGVDEGGTTIGATTLVMSATTKYMGYDETVGKGIFSHYRIVFKDTVDATHGTLLGQGIAK